MKRVATCINEAQYKVYTKKAADLGISEYQLTKQAVLEKIEEPIEVSKMKQLMNTLKKATFWIQKDLAETPIV